MGQYQDVYIKNSRALIIHLSMRLEELTKGLLQRELMLLSQNVLIRKNDLVRQELETQIELLGLQVSRLSQAVTGGRNERDETDYQDKSRKLQEKLAGMRDGLQRLDREGLEDQNEEAKSLKDRIGKLDEQINGFDSQLDIHMKGGVSGTAYESDPAKNDGFIRTLNERIDEVKKSVKDAEAPDGDPDRTTAQGRERHQRARSQSTGGGYEDDAAGQIYWQWRVGKEH